MIPDRHEPAGEPLDDLCGDILQRHHAYAHGAVPVIRGWLARLPPDEAALPLLVEVRSSFAALAGELAAHLAKEENILFPALVAMAQADRSGARLPPLPFPTVVHPIRLMEAEHLRIADGLARLRSLTGGFAAPEGASESWRRAYEELARLDAAMQDHLRVENDSLFPKAVELERRLL